MSKYGITTDPTWELDTSDAANQPSDNSRVASYVPTIGSTHAVQGTTGNKPLFLLDCGDGQPGLLSDGARFLTANILDSSWNAGFTWFVVWKELTTPGAAVDGNIFPIGYSSSVYAGFNIACMTSCAVAGNFSAHRMARNLLGNQVLYQGYTGAKIVVGDNQNTFAVTASPTLSFSGNLAIGAADDSGDYASKNYVRHVIAYKGGLSEADTATVLAALQTKWGIDTAPRIMFEGDSITATGAINTGYSGGPAWPGLYGAINSIKIGLLYDYAVASTGIDDLIGSTRTNAVDAALTSGSPNVICLLIGTNNLNTDSAADGTLGVTFYNTLKSWASTRRSSHNAPKLVIIKILPKSGVSGDGHFEDRRLAFNAAAAADADIFWDGVVDLEASDSGFASPTGGYYSNESGVYIHPTDAAKLLIAKFAQPVVDAAALSPLAPTIGTATPSGTTINLTWTDNSSNETSFDIRYSKSSTFASGVSTTTAAANATAKTISSLDASSLYYFQVRSVNASGHSIWTAAASGTTGTATPSVTPSATPSTVTATTTALNANASGGTSPYTYVWTCTSQPGGSSPSFSSTTSATPTITFDEIGSYTFHVVVTDNAAQTGNGDVNVTVNATVTTITVDPATASPANGANQTFTQTAVDQFGAAMSISPTWSVIQGTAGTVNSSTGVYTAPSVGQKETVRATSGSAYGDATVTKQSGGGGGRDILGGRMAARS